MNWIMIEGGFSPQFETKDLILIEQGPVAHLFMILHILPYSNSPASLTDKDLSYSSFCVIRIQMHY